MKTVFYILWQSTWGILQTLLGFFVFLVHIREKHAWYHGAIVTGWKHKTSASLGLFLFISDERTSGKKQTENALLDELSERILIHEYGHTIQSLILGPLYLLVIGLPSALWCALPYCKEKRKTRHISYYSFYPEKWADRLGEKTVGKPIEQ